MTAETALTTLEDSFDRTRQELEEDRPWWEYVNRLYLKAELLPRVRRYLRVRGELSRDELWAILRRNAHESDMHVGCKEKAVEWLESKGLRWISEFKIPYHSGESSQWVIVDILGCTFKGIIIPMECGSLSRKKAKWLAREWPESFHLPYGATTPHPVVTCITFTQGGSRPCNRVPSSQLTDGKPTSGGSTLRQ